MSDGNYDRALLAQADDTTATNGRQNKQFYDADLLKEYDEQERQRQTAPASRSQTDLENGRQKEDYVPVSTPVSSKSPWYKTRNGIIVIVIAIIVVLGAVIGGAVGGTRVKGGSKSTQTTITSIPSSSTTVGQAGVSSAVTAGQSGGAQVGGSSATNGGQDMVVPTAAASSPESAGVSG
ncbi:hypothetical protein SCHPADRAFT_995074 [Schizopora paradoxa]|uniref:Uncharacterized protein n=1 Tax=Schizopora paradoxa TaxID=27342 RepID=A0A0H2RXL9_9AGAM|nr:hypothetical protein SCHPADRAFT_995074 [Schizopora paradoxa]